MFSVIVLTMRTRYHLLTSSVPMDLIIVCRHPHTSCSGMLDVVVTRQDLTAPDVKVVDVGLSDHGLLQWSVSSDHPVPAVETFVRRPWQRLDIDNFRSALS